MKFRHAASGSAQQSFWLSDGNLISNGMQRQLSTKSETKESCKERKKRSQKQ